ncbi:hypothetical protein [Bacillus cereus group sp. BfR-BA-01328]|uniref:hypothetical protein n=1 Tax=Bacillus cereus group sp. BfR-BA-01328 TaxID=2920304 RepID=UPI001F5922AE
MKIGDKVWILAPLTWENLHLSMKERFVEGYIISENESYWIIGKTLSEDAEILKWCRKDRPNFYTMEKEVEEECWLYANRESIGHKVKLCKNPEVLRRIAKLIDYHD